MVGSSGLVRSISNQVGCWHLNLGHVLSNVLKTIEFHRAHGLSLESGRLLVWNSPNYLRRESWRQICAWWKLVYIYTFPKAFWCVHFIFIWIDLQIQCLVSLFWLGIKYFIIILLFVYDLLDMWHYNKQLLTYLLMHQSFVSTAPSGPGISGAFS